MKNKTIIELCLFAGLGALAIFEQRQSKRYLKLFREQTKERMSADRRYRKLKEHVRDGVKNGEQLYHEAEEMKTALKTIQTLADTAYNQKPNPSVRVNTVEELAFAVKAQTDHILDYIDRADKADNDGSI